jgi:hypothetical protein
MEFDSMNPYESLEVIQSDSPQGLVDELKKIRTPIKILAIVQSGARSVAYVTGDIRLKEMKRKKEILIKEK